MPRRSPSRRTDENGGTHDGPSPAPELIEVRVTQVNQLFNTIDPSPFYERDLDPAAEEFIEGWAREVPRSRQLALLIHVDGRSPEVDDGTLLRRAVQQFFGRKADLTRRRLRELFRRGRVSLVIALVFLSALGTLANALSGVLDSAIGRILREGLLIGGWVAMWRPLEIFLYDWWPIRAQARLFDRLAGMPVTIQHTGSER
jgi:hypothetical protein